MPRRKKYQNNHGSNNHGSHDYALDENALVTMLAASEHLNGTNGVDPNAPNPQPLDLNLTIDTVSRYKHYDCRTYLSCLDTACLAQWEQFHCLTCLVYEPTQPDEDELKTIARVLEQMRN